MRHAIVLALCGGCWTASLADEDPAPQRPQPSNRAQNKAPPAFAVIGLAEVMPDGMLTVREMEPLQDSPEVHPGMRFDLVDCGGWIARGTVTHRKDVPWGIAISEHAGGTAVPCRDGDTSVAFAVVPVGAVDKGARAPVDPRALFASLPPRVQAWHRAHPAARHRDVVSWADIDNDGAVDLVEVHGGCDRSDPDYTCGALLARRSSGWQHVGRKLPR